MNLFKERFSVNKPNGYTIIAIDNTEGKVLCNKTVSGFVLGYADKITKIFASAICADNDYTLADCINGTYQALDTFIETEVK